MKTEKGDRRTPTWFFEQCSNRFGPFDCDIAASRENHLCDAFFSVDGLDAFSVDCWLRTNWGNVPYGPPGAIERWITKAREQRDRHGCRTLLLLPADTSTKWYHDVSRTELTELVPFRLAFSAPDGSTKGNSAKFGSLLVWIAPRITRPNVARFEPHPDTDCKCPSQHGRICPVHGRDGGV